MDLLADRTSTAHMKRNPLRLWPSTVGCLLMRHLRAVALAGTRLAKASAGTLRLHLLKVAAQVTVSVRRVHVRLCSAFPLREVFAQAHHALRQAVAKTKVGVANSLARPRAERDVRAWERAQRAGMSPSIHAKGQRSGGHDLHTLGAPQKQPPDHRINRGVRNAG